MMKRVIYSILTIVLSLSIIGLACSTDPTPTTTTTIVATTTTTTIAGTTTTVPGSTTTTIADTTTTVLGSTTTTTTVAGTTTTVLGSTTTVLGTTTTTIAGTTTTTVVATTTTTTTTVAGTTTTTTTTTTTIPTYTITFDKNDGSAIGSMSNQTIASGSSANLTANGFAKSGWSFIGWATTSGGSVAYADGASYTMGASNVILYAKWLSYIDMVSISGGTYTQTDGSASFSHTISTFSMGKYQVTYELWWTVYQWAITNGYNFANAGREGNDGTDGAAPTARKYEPVTNINWRDTIVWCNAYSEMKSLTPCYTYLSATIKDSRDSNATACDGAVCNWSTNGYRLPTEGEWQYVASNKGFTQYDYASGATADYTDATETGNVAWYSDNSGSTTHNVGTKTAMHLVFMICRAMCGSGVGTGMVVIQDFDKLQGCW